MIGLSINRDLVNMSTVKLLQLDKHSHVAYSVAVLYTTHTIAANIDTEVWQKAHLGFLSVMHMRGTSLGFINIFRHKHLRARAQSCSLSSEMNTSECPGKDLGKTLPGSSRQWSIEWCPQGLIHETNWIMLVEYWLHLVENSL